MRTLFLTIISLYSYFSFSQDKNVEPINELLENWHQAASKADFNAYFNLMTSTCIFIGTDPTENWTYDEFKTYAKPHFDKGKAWEFSTLERNIFMDKQNSIAWFDELLDTQMGICRGSGIAKKTKQGWKIQHYVLSIAIPNKEVKAITELKKQFDNNLISELKKEK